ncbi:MAG: hypothetical protein HY692_02830, partial [Cyanobacteria bacterium NC_groundwater_1444_Ag_S-0.65um_54_12]|nr:hypothetical protein [Cyanobacteria bacterium NC_groundwater_1444_Ag_S-0.65um_54_12]
NTTITLRSGGSPVTSTIATPTNGAAPKLSFSTATVTVKPNNYLGLWGLRYGNNNTFDWIPTATDPNWIRSAAVIPPDKTFTVLKGIVDYYFLTFYPGRSEHNLGLSLDPGSGNLTKISYGDAVTSDVVSFSGTPATTLTFNTQAVPVTTNGWWGQHGIQYGGSFLNYYNGGPLNGGWSWLPNALGSAGWMQTANAAANNWYLLRGMKSYYLHAFYPLASTHYRVLDLAADGTFSFPNDGDAIDTVSPYTSADASGIVLRTAAVTFNYNTWRGSWELRYGNDSTGWTTLMDDQFVAGMDRARNRTFTVLGGIKNYYYLRFWPGLQYFLNLHWDPTTARFGYYQPGSGIDASSEAVNLSTNNQVTFNTRQVQVAFSPAGSLGTTWQVKYGEGPLAGNLGEQEDTINTISYTSDSITSRDWKLLYGMRNYYWVQLSSQAQGSGFGTNAAGAPTVGSVSVAGKTFTLAPNP